MSSAIFAGGGGAFVDLADLLARDRVLRAVPTDMRPRFDALAVAQEARLLAQAQRLDRTSAKALDGYYEAMLPLQEAMAQPAPEGETPEQQAARRANDMQRLVDLAADFGKEPRKVLASNFAANRAALAELTGVLPDAALAELRAEAAGRSLGRAGRSAFGSDMATDAAPGPAVVAARIRRSGILDQADTERSRAIVDAWRIEHASAIEEYVGAVLETSAVGGVGIGVEANDPGLLRVARSAQSVRAVEQTALRALGALVGARAAEFLAERDVQGESRLEPTPVPESADSVLRGLAASPGRLTGWFFQVPDLIRPADAREIDRQLELVGVEAEARAMIESVVTAWRAREWDARFAPILDAWKSSSRALDAELRGPSTDAASLEKRAALHASNEAARGAAVGGYFAAEDALLADLAAALALDGDGPEFTALRLSRLALLDRGASAFGEAGPALATPLAVIAQSGVGADSGKAFVTQSLPAWRALAASIPGRVRERLSRAAELGRLQWLAYGAGATAESNERVAELSRRMIAADLADSARIRSDLEGAFAAFEPIDAVATRALRGAARQIRHPDLHRPSESASAQLAQALELAGVDEAQLARLDALRAEYDSVFESLTQRMIEADEQIAAIAPERFEETIALRESLEKLRFQRNERTEKARGEARRILGDALASRIRGLVPNEDDELLSPRRREPQPFGASSGDDD